MLFYELLGKQLGEKLFRQRVRKREKERKKLEKLSIFYHFRLAIVFRCPGYLEGGVPALANPCLYICENSSQIALQYACRQLGLPVTCIRLVPASTSFG